MEKISCGAAAAGQEEEEEEEATWFEAWGLITSFAVSMTLKAAIELGLLDALSNTGGRPLTAGELSADLPAEDKAEAAASVDRILRLLASFNVVKCWTDDDAVPPAGSQHEAEAVLVRRYTPAPLCRWLTRNSSGASLAPYSMYTADQDYMKTWHQLAASVAGGGPPSFERVHGVPIFDYFPQNLRLSGVFNQAMVQISVMVTSKLLDRYNGFDTIDVLVDVGGGTGSTLEMITSRYKHIKAINFDLPHVISQAPTLPGVKHISGNMFADIPVGDAIFLKTVLHLHGDNDCIKILKNCHRALPEKGRLIAVEFVLPTTPEATRGAQNLFILDVMMFSNFREGKERTEQEFLKLAREAGFSGAFRSTYVFGNFWALQYIK